MAYDEELFAMLTALEPVELTPELLLHAYTSGFFPMADATGRVQWYSPDPRAVFFPRSLEHSTSMSKAVEKAGFETTVNRAFDDVIRACSRRLTHDDEEVWISEEIVQAYARLHELGIAHSVETWRGDELVGGLYGVSIGTAFFGESMFSRVSNASKAAFMSLVRRLKEREYTLLDSQIANAFTLQLGASEIPRSEYLILLENAMTRTAEFA